MAGNSSEHYKIVIAILYSGSSFADSTFGKHTSYLGLSPAPASTSKNQDRKKRRKKGESLSTPGQAFGEILVCGAKEFPLVSGHRLA